MIKKRFIELYKDAKKIDFFKYMDNSSIVKALAPSKDKASYQNILRHLNKADFSYGVERYYSYRILTMIFCFIILLCLNNRYIAFKNRDIIYGQSYQPYIIGFSGANNSAAQINSDPKRLLLVKTAESTNYKKIIRSSQLQQLATKVKQLERDNDIEDDDNKIAIEVLYDLTKAASYNISAFNILLIFALSIFSGRIIDCYLHIKTLLRDAKIENEVDKLEYHAVILIKGSKMSVENILIRLRDYSNYLTPYFNKCLMEYPVDHILAIDNLISNVDNSYFTKFISIIEQYLLTNIETNIKLLETQKDISFVLSEEKRRGKILKTSRLYAEVAIPIYIFAVFIIILPLFTYVNRLF